jgi:hypothetical protein
MPFMSAEQPRSAPPRKVYRQIVDELEACGDASTLETYLFTIGEELIQFKNELQYLWEGDGADFIGLNREVKAAVARCGVDW